MDYQAKSDLVNALAKEFNGKSNSLELAAENYITDTGAMDCTAIGIPLDDLKKTKAVIEQHENKYRKETSNPMSVQYLLHLRIAKKCVEEIMSHKTKHNI